MIYGYVRVSTYAQRQTGNSLEEQTTQIHKVYPSACIVSETGSGAKFREKFSSLIESLEDGDTLVVTKLDRFCRSVKEGLSFIDELRKKKVKVHILNMGLIEDTPMGRMMVTMLLAFAEFERQQIIERTQAGKEIARQNNPDWTEGRKKIRPESFAYYEQQVREGRMKVMDACHKMGICKSTYYNILRERKSDSHETEKGCII